MSETHKHTPFIVPTEHEISVKQALAITLHYLFISTRVCSCFLTSQPAVKVGVGGNLEARMWQQEAADVGEAGVDVLPYILQLFMLVLFYLFQQTAIYFHSESVCLSLSLTAVRMCKHMLH